MTGRRAAAIVAVIALAGATWWVLFIALPRWTAPKPPALPPPEAKTEPAAKIRARLHYLSEDGLRLQPVDSEVPFGEGALEQGRQLVLALLTPPPPPLVSTIPQGTTLKGFYLSGQGVAFVDLSGDATRAHRGGSLDEIFTVYSVVNTLTDNLPAVLAVQLLVDGHQVDTLAGHVDIRRPLKKDLRWTELPRNASPQPAAAGQTGASLQPPGSGLPDRD
jgi:hypothetical protein